MDICIHRVFLLVPSATGDLVQCMWITPIMVVMKASLWIGCIRTERGQVARAMYNRSGGALGGYLRWGSNGRRAFGM
jgi:hypothetical protein